MRCFEPQQTSFMHFWFIILRKIMLDTNDDDELVLQPDTLAALQEFLVEKADREKQQAALMSGEDETTNVNFDTFEEDWQLSQFWYDNETKQTLSNVCQKLINANGGTKIALLSCPSLYDSIRKVNMCGDVRLFEYDRRFSCYGQDFVYYDYNQVTTDPDYMNEYLHQFDVVLMDPPFLAQECISKLAMIVKRISKDTAKLILCSGEVVENWAKTYLELNKCRFQPQHERNLGNKFASYANFPMDDLISS